MCNKNINSDTTIYLNYCYVFFLIWRRCEKKKDVLQEKVTTERKEFQNKAEEEQYMKEERDKMALEMYENWLVSRSYCSSLIFVFETDGTTKHPPPKPAGGLEAWFLT